MTRVRWPYRLQCVRIVQLTDSDSIANHLAICVLRRWRRSIPKGVFWPANGYLEPISSMNVDILYEVCPPIRPRHLLMIRWRFRFLNSCTPSISTTSAKPIGLSKHCLAIQIRALRGTSPLKTIQPFQNVHQWHRIFQQRCLGWSGLGCCSGGLFVRQVRFGCLFGGIDILFRIAERAVPLQIYLFADSNVMTAWL